MHTIEIKGLSGTCQVSVGVSHTRVSEYVKGRRGVLVLDSSVSRSVDLEIGDFHVIELEGGESIKNLRSVEKLYKFFLECDLDKSSLVVAVGGGCVCDVVGFAAATFMRGIACGFVPTTLLAQIDASIGGKNGVNFQGFKNVIGTIRQPEFVIIDPSFLSTLPIEQVRSGFAEIIKHAIIADVDLLRVLETKHQELISLEKEALSQVIFSALKIKAQIVQGDETEKKDRVKLNFGHTVGHAIEATAKILHGEAVGIGMLADARLSQRKGFLSTADVERLQRVLELYKLPTSISTDIDSVIAAMRRDKKRSRSIVRVALLSKIGQADVYEINQRELEEMLPAVCKHC